MAYYRKYPNADIVENWQHLLSYDRTFIVDLEQKWDEIHTHNKQAMSETVRERNERIRMVSFVFEQEGIEIYTKPINGHIKTRRFEQWFTDNVVSQINKKFPYNPFPRPTTAKQYQEVNGVRLTNEETTIRLVNLFDNLTEQLNKE